MKSKICITCTVWSYNCVGKNQFGTRHTFVWLFDLTPQASQYGWTPQRLSSTTFRLLILFNSIISEMHSITIISQKKRGKNLGTQIWDVYNDFNTNQRRVFNHFWQVRAANCHGLLSLLRKIFWRGVKFIWVNHLVFYMSDLASKGLCWAAVESWERHARPALLCVAKGTNTSLMKKGH